MKNTITTTVTNFKSGTARYLDLATTQDKVVRVRSKNGCAVLVSESYFNSLIETCYLLSISGMKDAIVEGINTPTYKCEDVDWKTWLNK